jgi:predicted butyrate kinase (DUF1464 family)
VPRVVGIDPGTVSVDVCGLEDGAVFLEASVPSRDLAAGRGDLLELLRRAAPLDLVAGPSGYGLPLVRIQDLGERDLELLCLGEPGGAAGVGGLRALIGELRAAGLPVVFTPGVIHLPTVPAHRKLNRVDMGTADKVCAAAFAIHDQAERLGIPCRETSFVLVELGGAFTAVVSVERGRIVSGQGGSSGPMGYRAAGALDAESAFLLGNVSKDTVFSGGAAFVAGSPDASPEALASRGDAMALCAREGLVEGALKAVAAELALVPEAREVLLSGRLSRIAAFRDPLCTALRPLRGVRCLEPGAVKEAARGAALVADGLAGGARAELVDGLRLREAAGTSLDHLYLAGADRVRAWASPAS